MHDGRSGPARATRRAVLAGLGTGGLALGHSWLRAHASAPRSRERIAGGKVYEDGAATGQSTQLSRGIGGILVSNGCDIVETDADGNWALPVSEGDCVFVIKPAQWRMASRHGAPVPFWRVIERGPAQTHIGFALERHAEASRFDVLMVADTQASNARELEFVRQDLMTAVRKTPAAFAIHHGDVMGDDLSLLPDYLDIVRKTGISWHHCAGNHDMDHDPADATQALATWQRSVGPGTYAFSHGDALFIVLNTIEYLPPALRTDPHRPYRGYIPDRDLKFVKRLLARTPHDQLAVVSMHIPLASFATPDCPSAAIVNGRALLDVMAGRPNTLSFAGHSHTTEHHMFGAHRHQVLTAACGSWWSGAEGPDGVPVADSRDGSPRGHHVLSVDGHHAATRFVPAGGAGAQMRLMLTQRYGELGAVPDPGVALILGGDIRQQDLGRHLLLADVFDGRPATRVTVDLVAGEGTPALSQPVTMTRVAARDPYVHNSFASAPHLCKPWVEACVSSHMWSAPMPAHLPPGRHTFTVTAVSAGVGPHSASLAVHVAA